MMSLLTLWSLVSQSVHVSSRLGLMMRELMSWCWLTPIIYLWFRVLFSWIQQRNQRGSNHDETQWQLQGFMFERMLVKIQRRISLRADWPGTLACLIDRLEIYPEMMIWSISRLMWLMFPLRISVICMNTLGITVMKVMKLGVETQRVWEKLEWKLTIFRHVLSSVFRRFAVFAEKRMVC